MVIQPITEERWQQAQKAERKFHDGRTWSEKAKEYKEMYSTYLAVLGFDIAGSGSVNKVLEVGCADVPMLYFVKCKNAHICEPMPSKLLNNICYENDFTQHSCKFEDMPEPAELFNEIWLFNVMQHVQDPEKFIEKAKRIGRTIRFFEPIDWPIEIYHPFSYTIDDYKRWFGGCVQFYKGGSIKGFHESNCAYGVWRANREMDAERS